MTQVSKPAIMCAIFLFKVERAYRILCPSRNGICNVFRLRRGRARRRVSGQRDIGQKKTSHADLLCVPDNQRGAAKL